MYSLKVKYPYLFPLIVCIFLLSSGCSTPPLTEIAGAERALLNAQKGGGQIYATDEYKSAESKLEEARKELEKYHYSSAKSLAIESKNVAILAKEITEREKERLTDEAVQTLKSAKDALQAAEATGGKTYDVKAYDEAFNLIAEAEMALSKENFHIAIEKAAEAKIKARRLELAAKRAHEMESELQQNISEELEEMVPDKGTFLPQPKRTGKENIYYDTHIVRRGECLWIISGYKGIYGNPFMWPLIYKANYSYIKDPDLIFPGQYLGIPRNNGQIEIDKAIYFSKHRGSWSLYDDK